MMEKFKVKKKHAKLTDKRLTEAPKEVLGIHYFKYDEEFLKWAEENYYCEAS